MTRSQSLLFLAALLLWAGCGTSGNQEENNSSQSANIDGELRVVELDISFNRLDSAEKKLDELVGRATATDILRISDLRRQIAKGRSKQVAQAEQAKKQEAAKVNQQASSNLIAPGERSANSSSTFSSSPKSSFDSPTPPPSVSPQANVSASVPISNVLAQFSEVRFVKIVSVSAEPQIPRSKDEQLRAIEALEVTSSDPESVYMAYASLQKNYKLTPSEAVYIDSKMKLWDEQRHNQLPTADQTESSSVEDKEGLPAGKQQEYLAAIHSAVDHIQSSRSQQAIEKLTEARSIAPQFTTPDFVMGLLYACFARDFVKAEDFFSRVLRRDAANEAALNNRGLCMLLQADGHGAVSNWKQATNGRPIPEIVQNIGRMVDYPQFQTDLSDIIFKSRATRKDKALIDSIRREIKTHTGLDSQGSNGWMFALPRLSGLERTVHASLVESVSNMNWNRETNRELSIAITPHLLVTTRSAVESSEELFCTSVDAMISGSPRPARVIAVATNRNVALLYSPTSVGTSISLASSLPALGEEVLVYSSGSTIGGVPSATKALLAGLPDPVSRPELSYNIGTALLPGGGPVVNQQYELIALHADDPWSSNFSSTTSGNGVSIDDLQELLRAIHLEAYWKGDSSEASTPATVSRATVPLNVHFDQPTFGMERLKKNTHHGSCCLEDRSCLYCSGNGKIKLDCIVKDCHNGEINYTETVEIARDYKNRPIYGAKAFRKPCTTCRGIGFRMVDCELCRDGIDPKVSAR